MTKDLHKSLILSEEAPHQLTCENCQAENLENSSKSLMNTRRKLLCLLSIAILALFSIVLISEQLIARHLSRLGQQDSLILEPKLTILNLEDWGRIEPPGPLRSSGALSHLDLKFDIIQDGIFWSDLLEARISRGPSDTQTQLQLEELRNRKVKSLDKPDWLHCGREQNRFVHFADGSKACARFRPNHAEFVQGEIMAFYLARLLGITNTPAVILSQVRSI